MLLHQVERSYWCWPARVHLSIRICRCVLFSLTNTIAHDRLRAQSYAQVDESEWLKSRGLSYRDVSSPDLLATNAVLFNAWTEKCIATYRAATPHEGYAALLRLRDAMNRDPSNAALVAELHAAMRDGVRAADLPRDALPGRMFVATTNVDSMFLKAGFDECDVYHMHGRYERVQCSALHDGSASSWRRFDAAPCRNETWLLDAAWKPTGG